jgi:Flp pilus assembly protein TadD
MPLTGQEHGHHSCAGVLVSLSARGFLLKHGNNQDLQLAFSLHRAGRFNEAAGLYRKIIKRNPKNFHALQSLGIIEASNGNLGEAASLMARSLSIQPPNPQFFENYATVLCQMGAYKAALVVKASGPTTET